MLATRHMQGTAAYGLRTTFLCFFATSAVFSLVWATGLGCEGARSCYMALFRGKRDEAVSKILNMYRRPHRYRTLKPLGEGGLAYVSSCFDTYLSRVVALKALKEENLANSFLVQSFVNEVRLLGYLHHPGVVSVFDTFVLDKGCISYTMTLVEGDSLAQLLDTDNMFQVGPRLQLAEAYNIISKLAETMAYVHDRGVIHLDIKPENIMVGRYGEVMLMDWGNARLYNPEPYMKYLTSHTEDPESMVIESEKQGMVLGTPLYMSPEQTTMSRNLLTPGSDVFSAGIVLYEMLTGVRPFLATTADEAMHKVRKHQPQPVRELNTDVPLRLSQICMKMLEKDPLERYPDFREVALDLSELHTSGQGFSSHTYEPGEVIFREGDAGEYAFTVVSGVVEISKQVNSERKVLARLGKGEIVGELAILTDHPRTATATAVERTVIRVMGEEDVKRELEKMSPWVGEMIRALSERFIGINDRLAKVDEGIDGGAGTQS